MTPNKRRRKYARHGIEVGVPFVANHKEQIVEEIVEEVVEEVAEQQAYVQETTFEVKPSLWQRIKNSKVVRAIRYAMKIKVVLQYPALPEGRGE